MKSQIATALFSILILILSATVRAAPMPLKTAAGAAPTRILAGGEAGSGALSEAIRGGAIHGGTAADEFSLLAVDVKDAGRSEQIVLSYGDTVGKPVSGDPGFFHAVLDRKSKRISIDLAQVTKTAVDPVQLKNALAKSKYVASSDMTMDPEDLSTNITLLMKVPVELRAGTEKGGGGRVVFEFNPLQSEKAP